jgi:ABC-type multidrug transport system ATPase subunit
MADLFPKTVAAQAAGAQDVQLPPGSVTESLSGVGPELLENRRPQLRELARLLQVEITDMVGLRGCTLTVAGSPAAVGKAMPLLENALLGSSSWQPTPPPGLAQDLDFDDLSICLSEAAKVADLNDRGGNLRGPLDNTLPSGERDLPYAHAELTSCSAPCISSALADALQDLASCSNVGLGADGADTSTKKKVRKRKNGKAPMTDGTENLEQQVESVQLSFPTPAAIEGVKSRKKTIMVVDQVSFKHENAKIVTLSDLMFTVSQTSRVLVVGASKSGKSTLTKLLLGSYTPTHGSISKAVGLHLGCFSQESINDLDNHTHETPVRYITSCNEGNPQDHAENGDIEAHLKLFGLGLSVAHNTLVGKLSVTEKVQLALALTFWSKPQIVVFDEPSACVDGAVLAMLRQAIQNFKGGVIILSHTKHKEVYEDVATEKMIIRGGKVQIEGGPPQRPVVPSKAEAASTIRELEKRLREVNEAQNESEMHDIFNRLEKLKAGLK